MERSLASFSALAAGTLVFVVGTSTAHALLPKVTCQKRIASEGLKFVSGLLKLNQNCKDADLRETDSCAAPDAGDVQRLRDKLRAGIDKKCTNTTIAELGFPGPCNDQTPLDPFTLDDLKDCIESSHEALINGICIGGSNINEPCAVDATCPGAACRGILRVEYDLDVSGPLIGAASACQTELAHTSSKFLLTVLRKVQKCRNDILAGKLSGLEPKNCATVHQKTAGAITKARIKTVAKIRAKCDDATANALQACEPDQMATGGTCSGGSNAGEPCGQLLDCPDSVGVGTACSPGAAPCETTYHQFTADDPVAADPADLIDYQYATPGTCGDNRLNQLSEECDGTQDDACPGKCGSPSACAGGANDGAVCTVASECPGGACGGFFACLCRDSAHRRTRVIEHANADLDNGWKGLSHDSGVVEGGGYVADLWDCTGPATIDPICNVGPTCSLGLQEPCSPAPNNFVTGDAICAAKIPPQGVCRTTRAGATGPHCNIDFQRRCDPNSALHCTMPGDKCVKTLHGAPLPLSAGSVSVCVVNVFTEDVVGTTNLNTGEGAARVRQRSFIHTGDGNHPCPVCGGFCSGNLGTLGAPGARTRCDDDADCPGSFCVTANICSFGDNADQPCRPNPPFGGDTEFFGNPSVDCPPPGSKNISGAGLDILFNPATTATTTMTASFNCGATGYGDRACIGGPNDGRPCTTDDCPGGSCVTGSCVGGDNPGAGCSVDDCPAGKFCTGGANHGAACSAHSGCPAGTCSVTGGRCNEQCFCPYFMSGLASKPNDCAAACVGGANDAQGCVDDSECAPPGFCHVADCRINTPPDNDSVEEGLCTAGPVDNHCSVQTFQDCDSDAECQPPACPFCAPTETCVTEGRQCFLNGQITRVGAAGVPDRISVAVFCIGATNALPDGVAGLPGPGALTQPMSTIEVGFP